MLLKLLHLASVGTALNIIIGYFGQIHPAFDTLANFRWHLSLALLAIALLLLLKKSKKMALVSICFAILGAATSFLFIGNSQLSRKFDQSYTLLHFNLLYNNPIKDKALRLIQSVDADIVSLNETSRTWMPKLAVLDKQYPHKFHCPEWSDIGGVMIFSKFPFTSTPTYCHHYAALGMSEIDINGQSIALGSAHLRWPWPASGPKQVTALLPFLKTIGPDALIAGDFNASSWTYTMQRFTRNSTMKLVNPLRGTWIHGRLPASLTTWFGLSLDHILTKGKIRPIHVKTLEPAGSDHLPVLFEFELEE